jgi:hypothetical protein
MRTRTAVLLVTLALLAPPAYGGRGGSSHARGARAGGFGGSDFSGGSNKAVHVHGYTRNNGTAVQDYDRSAPGTASSSKTRSTKSDPTSSNLDDTALTPTLAPKGLTAAPGGFSSRVVPGSTATSSTPATTQTVPSAATTNGSQTTTPNANNVQFVNGFPFYLPWALGYSTDPNTLAQRQYGHLVSNARSLIQAGVYPPAVKLLQRVIAGAPPTTRVAVQARNLLASIPGP